MKRKKELGVVERIEVDEIEGRKENNSRPAKRADKGEGGKKIME